MPWLDSNSGQRCRSRRSRYRVDSHIFDVHFDAPKINYEFIMKTMFRKVLSTCRLDTQELHFYAAPSL